MYIGVIYNFYTNVFFSSVYMQFYVEWDETDETEEKAVSGS